MLTIAILIYAAAMTVANLSAVALAIHGFCHATQPRALG